MHCILVSKSCDCYRKDRSNYQLERHRFIRSFDHPEEANQAIRWLCSHRCNAEHFGEQLRDHARFVWASDAKNRFRRSKRPDVPRQKTIIFVLLLELNSFALVKLLENFRIIRDGQNDQTRSIQTLSAHKVAQTLIPANTPTPLSFRRLSTFSQEFRRLSTIFGPSSERFPLADTT